MHEVVVYSRRGCHLCDEIKEVLRHAHGKADFVWREVDIDSNIHLRKQYNDQIPVVFIDGRKAFKYRMSESHFLRTLAGRA